MNLNKSLLFILCISVFSCNIEPYEGDISAEEIEEIDESQEETEEEETTDNVLLKRIVYNKDTEDEYTETFNYDGNKLTNVDYGDGYKNVYTYDDNDNLVKDEFFANSEVEAFIALEYNTDGNIDTYIETFFEASGLDDRSYKHVFTYNNDGTITNEVYIKDFDLDPNPDFELDYTETITLDEKNITEIADDEGFKISYTYDDKNNAFENIHAIKVLNFLTENEFGAIIYGNTNNITSFIEDDNTADDNYNESYEYTYNDNNYPKTAIYTSKYGSDIEDVETIEYFYE